MDRLASKRPSPSLVLSMITLFVALTSTAGALSGTGNVQRGDLAKHSVTARALAPGAVKKRALANRSVTTRKLATDAVTEPKLAHFSVGAFALGDTTTVSAPIVDADPTANDFAWTSSSKAVAVCPSGSTLLGGGVSIGTSTFQKAFVQTSAPIGDRWEGVISTDTGGASPGVVYATCLL